MKTETVVNEVNLWFCEGSSDKVYWAGILERDNGYVVAFSYGRRGSHMTEGFKTDYPVGLPEAEKIFNKLVASKLKKGYNAS